MGKATPWPGLVGVMIKEFMATGSLTLSQQCRKNTFFFNKCVKASIELGLVSFIREGPVNHSCVSFLSEEQSLRVPGCLSRCPQPLLPEGPCPLVARSRWSCFPPVIMSPWLGSECSGLMDNTQFGSQSRIWAGVLSTPVSSPANPIVSI